MRPPPRTQLDESVSMSLESSFDSVGGKEEPKGEGEEQARSGIWDSEPKESLCDSIGED